MQAGRLNRARRGEWIGQRRPATWSARTAKLQFDPDEQVQSVLRLILDQFAVLGSLSGLLRHLRQQQIELPFRVPGGPNRGQLHWHRPHRETLRSLLRRPAYAGAYTWGRRPLDPRRQVPGRRGRGRVETEPQDCAVFLPDNHPAYISWEQYQSNLRRLQPAAPAGTRPRPGAADGGRCWPAWWCAAPAVAACRRATRETLRYDCQRQALDYGSRLARAWSANRWSSWSPSRSCEVVTPASLELSLRAAAECERERAALDQQWQQRLERARQDTARVYRQYNAVEPENRLVARTLERQWEEALLAERALEEDYTRFQQTATATLDGGRACPRSRTLAHNLPAVWQSPQTGVADKRQVVRLLLERVVVWAPASSQEVTVHLHWSLGTVTEHQLRRPVRSWGQLASTATVLQLIGVVAGGGLVVAPHGRGTECRGLSDTQRPIVPSGQCPATAGACQAAEDRGSAPGAGCGQASGLPPAVAEKPQVGRPSR